MRTLLSCMRPAAAFLRDLRGDARPRPWRGENAPLPGLAQGPVAGHAALPDAGRKLVDRGSSVFGFRDSDFIEGEKGVGVEGGGPLLGVRGGPPTADIARIGGPTAPHGGGGTKKGGFSGAARAHEVDAAAFEVQEVREAGRRRRC